MNHHAAAVNPEGTPGPLEAQEAVAAWRAGRKARDEAAMSPIALSEKLASRRVVANLPVTLWVTIVVGLLTATATTSVKVANWVRDRADFENKTTETFSSIAKTLEAGQQQDKELQAVLTSLGNQVGRLSGVIDATVSRNNSTGRGGVP